MTGSRSAGGLWYAGVLRQHIIHFNGFILTLLGISILCVAIVLYGTGRHERIVRDEIKLDEIETRLDG